MRSAGTSLTACGLLALSSACSAPTPVTSQADAGETGSAWKMVRHPDDDLFVAVWVNELGDIYTIAQSAPYSVFSSHDAGATWGRAFVDDSRAAIISIVGVGPSGVYAAGCTGAFAEIADAHPFVVVSNDRGATFTPTYPSFDGALYAITADSAGNLLAVGASVAGGFFVRSVDGAATWTRALVPGTSSLGGIWLAADGTIYACGTPSPSDSAADAGVDAAAVDGSASASPAGGVVVRSIDGGASWSVVATAPARLFDISGTPDGERVVAVGGGYTEIELAGGSASWVTRSGDPALAANYKGDLGSVWVPDAVSDPYMAMGNAGYVLRSVSAGSNLLVTRSEDLPVTGWGIQSGAVAITGTAPDDVWAVGSGIFHKTSR